MDATVVVFDNKPLMIQLSFDTPAVEDNDGAHPELGICKDFHAMFGLYMSAVETFTGVEREGDDLLRLMRGCSECPGERRALFDAAAR